MTRGRVRGFRGRGAAAAAALLLVLGSPARAADPAPPPEHLEAYVLVVQGDQARDRGEFKAAISAYRDALTRYARLAREKPDWNPDAVRFRMSYCAGEIEKVLRQTGKTEAQILSEPDASAGGELASARAMYLSLLKEHETLKEQLQTVRTEAAATRQMLADAEASMKKSAEEKRAAGVELETARAAAAEAQRQYSNRLEGFTLEIGRLESERASSVAAAR